MIRMDASRLKGQEFGCCQGNNDKTIDGLVSVITLAFNTLGCINEPNRSENFIRTG